jgi:hypothetical protein
VRSRLALDENDRHAFLRGLEECPDELLGAPGPRFRKPLGGTAKDSELAGEPPGGTTIPGLPR